MEYETEELQSGYNRAYRRGSDHPKSNNQNREEAEAGKRDKTNPSKTDRRHQNGNYLESEYLTSVTVRDREMVGVSLAMRKQHAAAM